jgi:hypothetical protein
MERVEYALHCYKPGVPIGTGGCIKPKAISFLFALEWTAVSVYPILTALKTVLIQPPTSCYALRIANNRSALGERPLYWIYHGQTAEVGAIFIPLITNEAFLEV